MSDGINQLFMRRTGDEILFFIAKVIEECSVTGKENDIEGFLREL